MPEMPPLKRRTRPSHYYCNVIIIQPKAGEPSATSASPGSGASSADRRDHVGERRHRLREVRAGAYRGLPWTGDLRRLLPFFSPLGTSFLVRVDVLARTAFAPREIPLGIVTASLEERSPVVDATTDDRIALWSSKMKYNNVGMWREMAVVSRLKMPSRPRPARLIVSSAITGTAAPVYSPGEPRGFWVGSSWRSGRWAAYQGMVSRRHPSASSNAGLASDVGPDREREHSGRDQGASIVATATSPIRVLRRTERGLVGSGTRIDTICAIRIIDPYWTRRGPPVWSFSFSPRIPRRRATSE